MPVNGLESQSESLNPLLGVLTLPNV
jgi:hypothetical protein